MLAASGAREDAAAVRAERDALSTARQPAVSALLDTSVIIASLDEDEPRP